MNRPLYGRGEQAETGICPECGEVYTPAKDSRFCSMRCRMRDYRRENRERCNEMDRARQKHLTRITPPEKRYARNAVMYRIRSGKWERQPCERCNEPSAQAHHPDYSKPLEVVWLCRECHELEHHPRLRIEVEHV